MSYNEPPPPGGDQYGQPPSGGQYGQPQPGYGAPQPTNKKAIWALVLGILGIVCCGFFTGIPALILGNNAKKEIDAGQGTGRGMATAGVVLGWISIAFGIIYIILVATGNFYVNFSSGS